MTSQDMEWEARQRRHLMFWLKVVLRVACFVVGVALFAWGQGWLHFGSNNTGLNNIGTLEAQIKQDESAKLPLTQITDVICVKNGGAHHFMCDIQASDGSEVAYYVTVSGDGQSYVGSVNQ
jgi:hypothetical protein